MKEVSYSDWVIFTFGLGADQVGLNTFYPGSAQSALHHCIHFFENSREVLDELPRSKAIEGMRVIPSIDGFGGLMSFPELAWEDRCRLADAQVPLFRDTFAEDPFDGIGFMWWEYCRGRAGLMLLPCVRMCACATT